MPIRVTCPSCSAILSVKDELAGRAVKCPKCGGVIPASAAAAPAAPPPPKAAPVPPPPAPEPESEESPFGNLDAPSAPPSKGSRRPTRSRSEDEDDERPARRGRARDEDEEDEDRGRKAKRRDDDEGEDEGGDDDRPRGRRTYGKNTKDKKGGSNLLLILGIIGGIFFVCCGGGGLGVYFFVIKPAKEGLENLAENLKEKNDKATEANYDKLKTGMTKSEVEAILGPGKPADLFTVALAFTKPDGSQNNDRINELNAKSFDGRVLYWKNLEDVIFVVFTEKPETGKVQFKQFVNKSKEKSSGQLDDSKLPKGSKDTTPGDKNDTMPGDKNDTPPPKKTKKGSGS